MRKRHERRSREQWSAIIEDQATSGLSIADYCQSNNIGLASFAKGIRQTPKAKSENRETGINVMLFSGADSKAKS